MTSYQTDTPVTDRIHQLIEEFQHTATAERPTVCVIGRETYMRFQREVKTYTNIDLPHPTDSRAVEFYGMMFSFINSKNYLAVR